MKKLRSCYHVKDARKLKDVIRENGVNVIITSPPYWALKDYGTKCQIGFGQDYEEYLLSMEEIFRQCFDITDGNGSLWVIADTFKSKSKMILLPFDITKMLQNIGWILRDIIIWNKEKTLPWSRKGQLRNTFEYILFFTKSDNYKYYIERIRDPNDLKEWWVKYPERYNPLGKAPKNIWNIPIPNQGSWNRTNLRHFCPFPPELVEKILLLTTDKGDLVMDPFAGSGIVLAQAKCMGRRWIGFDVNREFKLMFNNDVIPLTHKRWQLRKINIKYIESGQDTLQSKINKLRLLKYPKTLTKEMFNGSMKYKTEKIIHPEVIIAIKDNFNHSDIRKPHLFLKEKIYLIFRELEEGVKDQLEHIIKRLIAKKPLSKYGIFAEIIICTISDINKYSKQNSLNPNVRLNLYSKGKTYSYVKSATFKKWKEQIENNKDLAEHHGNGTPPILSNIKVKQDLIRTWKPSIKI